MQNITSIKVIKVSQSWIRSNVLNKMSVFRIQDTRGNIYLEDLLMRQMEVLTPLLSLTRQHI